jgi:hypothetical protein
LIAHQQLQIVKLKRQLYGQRRGGQHSQLRVRKPKSGEHGCRTPEEALAVMRTMATRWSDEDIAASLKRMGMPTGQGKT